MTRLTRASYSSIVFLAFFATQAKAIDVQWFEKKLQEFDADPEAAITAPKKIEKFDPVTSKPIGQTRRSPRTSEVQLNLEDVLKYKNERISRILRGRTLSDIVAKAEANDQAADLVDDLKYVTLEEMDSAGLRKSELKQSPWSGNYWPMYMLGAARRYADPNFPNSKRWEVNARYFYGHQVPVAQLSPAEKYDLLVGDPKKTFTNFMIKEGESYYNLYKKVEDWMGYCHGWSPASFMFDRPKKALRVLAADRKTVIPFYPDDIKALQTMLWANGISSTRGISGRCESKKPKKDRNGRILDIDCFDTNPGTWHLSLINQIGVGQRSFILDATYSYEVWTQPIYSYKYTYFNPITKKVVNKLEDALIPIEKYKNDRFKKYRSANTKYIAGIALEFVYMEETEPSPSDTDAPSEDDKLAVRYLYDVEMDAQRTIIGGEWYQSEHPDFLFVPEKDSRALSEGDQLLQSWRIGDWDGRSALTGVWTKAAAVASRRGQPLAAIVEKLVELANRGSPTPRNAEFFENVPSDWGVSDLFGGPQE